LITLEGVIFFQEKKERKESGGGSSMRDYMYFKTGQTFSVFEGSQALPARPSGSSTFEGG
jgi:hypothetical protein